MITLVSLTQYTDDLFAARWCDDEFGIDYAFNALHDGNGRSLGRGKYDPPHPVLTAEQMASAVPFLEPQHPVYELVAKGTAAKPEWAGRYEKAAGLVVDGKVRLVDGKTAVVSSSESYEITGKRCRCKWQQFHPDEPCSHYLAVRMARALNQPFVPYTEQEIATLNRRDNRRATDSQQAVVAGRGENIHERNQRQARRDGDGARQYWRMAYANGVATVAPEIHRRAMVGGD
ncbi:MAG: hypothetical protein KC413_07850 [Anaerolineales bacterium]|nr:hypothetical protein [Anaerolineales bacterium]